MIRLVHGFNVWDGGWSSLGPLRDGYRLYGHDTEIFSWGQSTLLSVRLKTAGAVESFIERQEKYPARMWVGHSHGAYVCTRAFESLPDHVEPPEAIVLVQPAMRTCYRLPDTARVVVRHNPHDLAVWMGKQWRRLNPVSWFARHPWGVAGRYGFDALPRDGVAIDTSDPAHGKCAIRGHSAHGGQGDYWARVDLISAFGAHQ